MMGVRPWFWLGAVGLLLAGAPARARASGEIDFNRDIRPILSDACYSCHGPGARPKAGLRLDRREGALKETEPGVAAVVPGDRKRSLLFQRVTTPGKGLMP